MHKEKNLIALICLSAMGVTAQATWTVTNLTPAGASFAIVNGVSSSQQCGEADIGPDTRAVLWSGTSSSAVFLSPAGRYGVAYGLSGNVQVGYDQGAVIWTGSAASRVILNAAGADAFAVDGGQQVGRANLGGHQSAVMWAGSASSMIPLEPPGSSYSAATGVFGMEQVGLIRQTAVGNKYRASLWHGTPESWVDLHPISLPNFQSYALGTSGDQQVGWTFLSVGNPNPGYASLWTGSQASFVSLNPVGVNEAEATAVAEGIQVGHSAYRACLWTGTADSIQDLHAGLPPEYTASKATCIYSGGTTTIIGGYGSTANGHTEAFIWSRPRRTVNGTVNTAGGKKLNSISIQFRLAGTMTHVGGAYAVPVQTNGTYTIRTPDSGDYDMTVNPPGYLRRTIHTDSTNANVINANLNLRPGDIVDDNVIDLSDYTKLITYFNKTSADPNWNTADAEGISPAMADIDGNNVVDLTDYTRLITNFNAVGNN